MRSLYLSIEPFNHANVLSFFVTERQFSSHRSPVSDPRRPDSMISSDTSSRLSFILLPE